MSRQKRLIRAAPRKRESEVSSLDGSSLQMSSAQFFDERGEGLILKGGPGLKDKTDRQLCLSATDAFDLTRTALQSYKKESMATTRPESSFTRPRDSIGRNAKASRKRSSSRR